MPAGVANDIFLLRRVGHWLIRESGQGHGSRVDPERMFGCVVYNERTLRNGAVQQLMGRGRWRGSAEVGSDNQNLIVGMARGVSLDPLDHAFGIVFWSNARFRRREIQPVEFERAEPHVSMRIGESRNDGPPLKINHL